MPFTPDKFISQADTAKETKDRVQGSSGVELPSLDSPLVVEAKKLDHENWVKFFQLCSEYWFQDFHGSYARKMLSHYRQSLLDSFATELDCRMETCVHLDSH